ncbi:hypothetical protein EST38_g10347 [Candolleomyces aberdarensis]|uniref:Uncharacterized protein n=1 Tax=Candolleomyces aberdarensis TaxID=2316362 RepID=A0A4V1Q2L5_9AGAR|nr:hypothetical protein EST38_g10347 [Candolleomyces aberdarensis]
MVNALEFPQPNPYAINTAPSGYPITRQRTNSMNHPSQERRRTYSNAGYSQDHSGGDPQFQPVHMFISFTGYNELRLENITELALKELREKIWPVWEDGVDSQPVGAHECVVKFRNQPWDMSGPQHLTALDLIVKLFTLCARRVGLLATDLHPLRLLTKRLSI